jgi:hypothetical protein
MHLSGVAVFTAATFFLAAPIYLQHKNLNSLDGALYACMPKKMLVFRAKIAIMLS